MYDYRVISANIPANQALSSGVDLGDATYIAIECPETLTTSTITFQSKAKPKDSDHPGVGDPDPEDWDNVFDDAGTEVSVTVAAGRVVVIGTATKAALAALRYLRIRSGTSAAPVNINPEAIFRFIVK